MVGDYFSDLYLTRNRSLNVIESTALDAATTKSGASRAATGSPRGAGSRSSECNTDLQIGEARELRDKKKEIRSRDQALQFLGVGKPMPDALLQQRIAYVKRGLMGRSKEGYAIQKQYAKYWSEIQKSQETGNQKQLIQAQDGVLKIHKELAKQKLAAPAARPESSGIVTGRIGATVTPPFDYAFTLYNLPHWDSIVGNPTLSGSANKDTGQISNSAVTDYKAESSGNVYSEMGIYFRSPWALANLSLSANPALFFEWWINCLEPGATSAGTAWLEISARQGDSTEWRGSQFTSPTSWFVFNQFNFDWGSNPGAFLSTQLNGLDPSYECLLYVAKLNRVDGAGWPRSLAGSVLSVTVPSLTFELDAVQIFE